MKGMIEVFFCDTYALVEIAGGNPAYRKYLEKILVTSELNLMELYYALLRDYGKETAEKHFGIWSIFVVNISPEAVKMAMEFKLDNKEEQLSYVDCIGYIFSRLSGMKFLTGDSKFKDKHGTEFVK